MSAKSIPFFNAAAFDPETVRIVGEAYDEACRALHDLGQPNLVNEVIVKRIIDVAKNGARDPQAISTQVLMDVGIYRTG